MYKNGFDINNLQWLMCHKTKPNIQAIWKNERKKERKKEGKKNI